MNNADSMTCCDERRENIPWLVNGTLSKEESSLLEAHLENCSECRADLLLHQNLLAAVLDRDVQPLAPGTRSRDILARADAEAVSAVKPSPKRWFAIAAGIAVLGVALAMLSYTKPGFDSENQRFETATSPGAVANVDYVLQLSFDDSVSLADRSQLARELPGAIRWNVDDEGVFDVHVQLSSPSLATLTQYENRVRDMAGVESAEFTALQLPMK